MSSTRREKVTLIGCGGWGATVARKLAARSDVELVLLDDDRAKVQALAAELGCKYSSDPAGYLMVTGTQRDSVTGGSVIIATPPSVRVAVVRMVLDGYGIAPRRLRVEKPLAVEPQDARTITAWCRAAGTRLSVGFTLLHHPLYEAAFAWMQAERASATRVIGTRYGAHARHRAAAVVDLGSHVAGVAAYLGASAEIVAEYDEDAAARVTQIQLDTGDTIYIDELAGTVSLPIGAGPATVGEHDALAVELAAFLADTHRGDARVGVGAAHIVWDHLGIMAGVAA